MYFKRPSFRRGGSTGIGQLSSNRQMYAGGGNIGGGIISGSNLGSRTGFSVLDIISGSMAEELTGGSNNRTIGTRTVPGSRQNIPTGGLKKGTRGARLISQLRNLSVPSASTTGLMSLPFVLPAGLAYMNKPETLAEKKVMQDYGPIDETFFDYDKYYADRKEASKVGDKISFSDALFMDPETGLYPTMLGRTEDRTKRAEIEKAKEERDDFEMPRGGGADFAEIAETVIADKKEDTPIKTDDDQPKEKTFDSIYEEEKSKLENY